ncbi:MAG: tetratricopeptide repeat protein [Ignavibacteria bacterium]|nr:tetratricopeptide repeat protein [Ignavibacteria bacterium]
MSNEELVTKLQRAQAESNKGNYELSEQLANEVFAELNKPTTELRDVHTLEAESWYVLAINNEHLGNFDKAIEQANRMVSLAELHSLQLLLSKAWNLFGSVYSSSGEYDKALEYYQKALTFHDEHRDSSSVAAVSKNIGVVYAELGSNDKALEFYNRALASFQEIGDLSGVAAVTGNIGNVYNNLCMYENALEYLAKAYAIHEELGEKSGVASDTMNTGNVYYLIGSYILALEYYQKALTINEELGNKRQTASCTGNMGYAFFFLKDYDNALIYQQRSLLLSEEFGNKQQVAYSLANLGNIQSALGRKYEAMDYLLRALQIQRELQSNLYVGDTLIALGILLSELDRQDDALEMLQEGLTLAEKNGEKGSAATAHKELAKILKNKGEIADSYDHFEKFYVLEQEVKNAETLKQAELLNYQRKQAEIDKQHEIQIASANAKHEATEQLLHNVLPRLIANKMLDGTKLIAEKHSHVSVLFADIVGFTKLSQRISAEELVEGLDRIFTVFDALAEKYGLEKIKTIGDCYMVVSGAPITRDDHAEAMARFAMEMQESIKEFKAISTGEEIQLRIGIHSGEVVAGVIGKKKFAYDIWGDTVNTASRMESHGEAGKIHVSEEFMQVLSSSSLVSFTSFTSFHFQERGEMEIKGKGIMKTYFMETKP